MRRSLFVKEIARLTPFQDCTVYKSQLSWHLLLTKFCKMQ